MGVEIVHNHMHDSGGLSTPDRIVLDRISPSDKNLGRVVRREQSSSIAIELTFALHQIHINNTNYYIWSKRVVKVYVFALNIVIGITFY